MAEAGATNSMQEGLEDFIKTHIGQLEDVHPGFNSLPWQQQLELVNPDNPNNIRSNVAEYARVAAQLDLTENDRTLGVISDTEALEETIVSAQDLFMTTLRLGAENGTLADPEAITRDLIRRGTTLQDGTLVTDLLSAVAYLQELIVTQRGTLEAVLSDTRFAGADPTRAREMIDDYVGTLEFYVNTLMNGETGIAALTDTMMELEGTRAYRAIDDAFGGILTYMTAINNSMPDIFLDYIAERALGPLAEVAAVLTASVLDRTLREAHPEILTVLERAGIEVPETGEVGAMDLAQFFRNVADTPEEAAEMFSAAVDTQLDIIRGTNGVTGTPEQVQSALTLLFGPEGGFDITAVPIEERSDTFTLLTSPAIAQAAVAAGPDVQVAYENWAVETFRQVNFQTISDLNNNLANPAFLETFTLTFNQSTGQLEIRPNEGIEFSIGRGGLPDATQPGQLFYAAYVGLRDNIDKLNQSLEGIGHLFTAGGGTMGAPEFEALLPLQLGVPVQFVTEPQGLGGLVPLESPIVTEGGDQQVRRTVADINAERAPNTDTAPIPNANPERAAATPNVFNPETRRFEPAPIETRPLGTTIPGGAPTTPDGQPTPTLDPRTAPAPTPDPTNPYATMGWDEIGRINNNTLSPDAQAQLQQRVTELIAAGEFADKSLEPNEKNARAFLDKFDPTANGDKAEDAARNSAYTAISTILLEPTMDTAPSGVNVQELAYTANNPIQLAEQFLGYNEVDQRDTLAAFFRRAVGTDFDPVELPWCARFVNAVLRTAGYNTDGADDWARSFLRVGEQITTPRRGDVVVFQRGNDPQTGHVGFFYGFDAAGNVMVLGGNQSNSVNISSYSVDDVLGYRRFTL